MEDREEILHNIINEDIEDLADIKWEAPQRGILPAGFSEKVRIIYNYIVVGAVYINNNKCVF